MENTGQLETRRLTVSPHMIYALIKNQAGTLAKAVLECVMNSIDAGATKVDIKVDSKTLRIVDDGCGFATRKSILSCFEVFGFEHKAGDRTYGQFGIGRAQLWNFCTTKWRTRTFSMDVDIKNKGLDYVLQENLEDVKGLTIEGAFYAPMKTSEILAFEHEFASLALYAQIPVTVNGKLTSKDPSKEKWTHDTPEAWINIRESGNLQVYNLGVFVREYPSYQVGCGGKIVTKPGVRLTLNMARNDIILTDCKVWKKIKPFLQNESDKRIKDTRRKLTNAEVDNLAMRFVAREIAPQDVKSVPFITDISGRTYTVESFIRKAASLPIITGPKDSQVMDRVNQRGMALVLADETLYRFGVTSPSELGALFNKMAEDSCFFLPKWKIKDMKYEDDATKVTSALNDNFLLIDTKELTKEEKAIISALDGYASRYIVYAMNRHGIRVDVRKIMVGTSDLADAWTDGRFNIVFNRKMLKVARKGLSGMHTLVLTMLHEYLHNESTAGSHKHDTEFFMTYHDLTRSKVGGEAIAAAAQVAFRNMMKIFREKDIPLIKALKDSIDDIDMSEEAFGPVMSIDTLAETSPSEERKIELLRPDATELPVMPQVLKRGRGRPRKAA